MREFTFENQALGSFMVYRLPPEEELDRTALGMLTHNEIPGLLPVSCLNVDAQQMVRFKVSSLTALMGCWNGVIRKEKLLTFLVSVCRAVLECQEYMMDPGKLVLRWDYVFVEPLSGEARLAYLPVTGEEESSVVQFLRELVQRTTFDPQEDGSHVAVIFNALNAPNFSVEKFLEQLQALSGGAKPKAAPARPIETAPPLQAQRAPQQPTPASVPTAPPHAVQAPPAAQQPPVGQPVNVPPMGQPMNVPPMGQPMNVPPVQQPLPGQKPPKGQKLSKAPKAPKPPKGGQDFGFAVPGMTPPAAPGGAPQGMAVPPQVQQPVPPQTPPAPPTEKKKGGFLGFGKKKEKEPAYAPAGPAAPPMAQPFQAQPAQTPVQPYQPPVQQPSFQQPPAPPMGGGRTVPLGGGQAAGHTVPFGQGEGPAGPGTLFLVRRLNGQRAAINKDVFHVGREQRVVDFCLTGGRNWVGTDHAYFLKKEDGYYLVDNNSMNHTWLNGQQLVSNQPYPVKAGDVIRMADEEFDLLGG